MLDNAYIDEMRELDNKDAKTMLADYGKTFGVDLKKTKSFDNMLADLEEAVSKIAEEPMPEDNDGMSITDLIDSKDDGDELLIDEIRSAVQSGDIKIGDEPLDVKIPEEVQKAAEEKGLVIVSSDESISGNTIEDAVEIIKKDESKFKLPESYGPRMSLMGRAPGYMNLPWWIYQWISENEDWKDRPTDFPHPTAHDTLFTLIYYINRDGSVIVRETKNSRFVTLK